MREMRFKDSRFSASFRGSSKQAICPFCFKIFYDKSTMNRHVSKRVCLGMQFHSPILIDDDDVTVEPTTSNVQSTSLALNSTGESTIVYEMQAEESPIKSVRVPCPYCNKLLKGERGVRKHIDFYGCPMAVGSKFE